MKLAIYYVTINAALYDKILDVFISQECNTAVERRRLMHAVGSMVSISSMSHTTNTVGLMEKLR